MNIKILLTIAVILILLMIKYWNFILFLMGLKAFRNERYEKAVPLIQKAAASGMHPKHRLTCGYILLTRGFEEEAEGILKPLLNLKAKKFSNEQARIFYSLLQWKQGKLNEAVESLEDLKDKGYISTVLYTNLGFFLIEQGRLDRALELNKEAYEYNNESRGVLDNLGTTYIKRGEWEKAAPLYEKLMSLSPAFPEAYYHQAQIHSHRGENDLALKVLEEGLLQKFNHISTVSRDKFDALKAELSPSCPS